MLTLSLSPLRGARGPEDDGWARVIQGGRVGEGGKPLARSLSPLRGARGPEDDGWAMGIQGGRVGKGGKAPHPVPLPAARGEGTRGGRVGEGCRRTSSQRP